MFTQHLHTLLKIKKSSDTLQAQWNCLSLDKESQIKVQLKKKKGENLAEHFIVWVMVRITKKYNEKQKKIQIVLQRMALFFGRRAGVKH